MITTPKDPVWIKVSVDVVTWCSKKNFGFSVLRAPVWMMVGCETQILHGFSSFFTNFGSGSKWRLILLITR